MRERVRRAVASARRRVSDGWEAWESPFGLMWARVSNGWQGAPQIEQEPMTDDEKDVVDYVLREEHQWPHASGT